ncbi:MAG: hypothetical protein J3R72DRAFT_455818 [Linnemannia gamsii]|nr:MAG: hypothetical protein J3R72DRAFT_455818 [Linnemannia gamsii]
MPAEPDETLLNTGVASSTFPSPFSSTSDPAVPDIDPDNSANQGQLLSRIPQPYHGVFAQTCRRLFSSGLLSFSFFLLPQIVHCFFLHLETKRLTTVYPCPVCCPLPPTFSPSNPTLIFIPFLLVIVFRYPFLSSA